MRSSFVSARIWCSLMLWPRWCEDKGGAFYQRGIVPRFSGTREEEKVCPKEASPIDRGGVGEEGGRRLLNGYGYFPRDVLRSCFPTKAPTEPNHSKMVDPASVGSSDEIPIIAEKRLLSGSVPIRSSDGIPFTAEKIHLVGFIFDDSSLSPESSMGPLLIHRNPQLIVSKEVGDIIPTSTSIGEPKPFVHLRVLTMTLGEPSSSKSDEEEPWDVEGSGSAELMLRKLLLHFPPLIVRDRWLDDLFKVSPNMVADERRKIVGAVKCPEELSVTQVFKEVLRLDALPSILECLVTTFSTALLEARNKAEEELKTSLVQHYAKGAIKGERRFFYKLQEMDRRANGAATLEAKEMEATEELCQDLSEAKALRARAVDLGAEGAKSRVKLDAARGRQVTLLREVELLFELEAAQVELARLWADLKMSCVEVVACVKALGVLLVPSDYSFVVISGELEAEVCRDDEGFFMRIADVYHVIIHKDEGDSLLTPLVLWVVQMEDLASRGVVRKVSPGGLAILLGVVVSSSLGAPVG
ncbi:hypothetical protein ACLOJK_018823 [Asimina triloba]